MTTQTTPCVECGMVPLRDREYHPYAACLMFKTSRDGDVVRKNLQAVLDEGEMIGNAKREI